MLDTALAACQKRIPGVRWRIQENTVFGEVYGSEFRLMLVGHKAFVEVSGKRRCRPSTDLDDLADVMRDSMVRRRDALNRALERKDDHKA